MKSKEKRKGIQLFSTVRCVCMHKIHPTEAQRTLIFVFVFLTLFFSSEKWKQNENVFAMEWKPIWMLKIQIINNNVKDSKCSRGDGNKNMFNVFSLAFQNQLIVVFEETIEQNFWTKKNMKKVHIISHKHKILELHRKSSS